MRWQSLVSIQNLKLAWRRINTGRNIQYKTFFRELYLVYESGLDENLRELHRKLAAKAWKPSHPVRIYLPKPSGLQRPLTLLGIEDQILLQAIANIFARKLRAKRAPLELQTVFSNKLTNANDSIFFTEQWQTTYRAFQTKCSQLFAQNYRWAAHFDLAAYYDTISHDLLTRLVAPRNTHPTTWDIVRRWLQKWSSATVLHMTGHGIPQGPVASDFLAEAFFLPIDLQLRKEGCTYIRYVDDIRLFGRTNSEVRQAAVMLEQHCRNRGLIPQSKKFEIRELLSEEDAMGALPSIGPTESNDDALEMSGAEALRILNSAVGGRPLRVRDKSRFRYVMYRAPVDRKVLNITLNLLPRHPEHIDAFVAYFRNFKHRHAIARAALNYLDSGVPYPYVRGQLWHTLARLGGSKELKECLSLVRADAKKQASCLALSWGVMHFLITSESLGLLRLGQRLRSTSPMCRALLARILPAKEFTPSGCVKLMLKGTLEEQCAAARELQRRQLTLTTLGLRQADLPIFCRNALKSLGVVSRRRRLQSDWIAERLVALYSCAGVRVWRAFLGPEYEHALQILIEAEARYPGAYSEWLSLQDSFNDITIRRFFALLATHNMPGHLAPTTRGRLANYGGLIAANTPFDRHYPTEAASLRQLHARRNQLPGSHPYDERGGAKNRWLTKKERDVLTGVEKAALDGIIKIVNNLV